MAQNNKITSNGTFVMGDTSNVYGTFTLGLSLTLTGSNITLDVKDLPSGSWTPLATQSLTDTRYMAFKNSGTSSVKLGASSAGAGFNPILQPNDICIISFSGSVQPLYALAGINPNSGSTLAYGGIES